VATTPPRVRICSRHLLPTDARRRDQRAGLWESLNSTFLLHYFIILSCQMGKFFILFWWKLYFFV